MALVSHASIAMREIKMKKMRIVPRVQVGSGFQEP
jgi:hypothetical protein